MGTIRLMSATLVIVVGGLALGEAFAQGCDDRFPQSCLSQNQQTSRPAPQTAESFWSLFQPPRSQTASEESSDPTKDTKTTKKKPPIKKQVKKTLPKKPGNVVSPARPVEPALPTRNIPLSVMPPLSSWHVAADEVDLPLAERDEDQRHKSNVVQGPIVVPSFMIVNSEEINEIDLAAPDLPSVWDQTWLRALFAMLGGGMLAASLMRILFIFI